MWRGGGAGIRSGSRWPNQDYLEREKRGKAKGKGEKKERDKKEEGFREKIKEREEPYM